MTVDRLVNLTIDGAPIQVPAGGTLRDACEAAGVQTPTLCWAENLTPVNVCRLCVVEVVGARVLVPACSRKAEEGMAVLTDSPRVRTSRKLVLELLGSSVDMSLSPVYVENAARYGARPERFGPQSGPSAAGQRDAAHPGQHEIPAAAVAANVAQPVKVDNDLFVRDYSKCMLCFKCVEACGGDAQNTFAISLAGRGFDARISTEYDTPLAESACVFCGNCIGVCPTGALMFSAEYKLRASGGWDESRQTVTDTICSYCGVGCTLTLRVQDNKIVRVTSPSDNQVTAGQLCIKGRFGWTFVEGDSEGHTPDATALSDSAVGAARENPHDPYE